MFIIRRLWILILISFCGLGGLFMVIPAPALSAFEAPLAFGMPYDKMGAALALRSADALQTDHLLHSQQSPPMATAATPTLYLPLIFKSSTWEAQLKVEKTGTVTVGGKSYASSSKLLVSWSAPSVVVNHYRVTALEGGTMVSATTTSLNLTLVNLKSGTTYLVSLTACLDANCTQTLNAAAGASGRTEEEYWQIQGTGNSFSTATKIVADGNTKPYPLRYGAWAGPELEGKTQLYYDPNIAEEKGVKLGLTSSSAGTIAALSSFTPISGFGLKRVCDNHNPCSGDSPAASVATFQVVPLSEAMGGKVRLFFEAEGTDHKARAMYLDSQDGYVGRDFNAGPATICASLADYSAGGGCQPTVIIGGPGDLVAPTQYLKEVRQFKIGYPTLEDVRWNGAPGTFMAFTAHFS
ncbi:MAG: fibronectin type III domain-containing protein, partial [Chloroflexi bacterium]|nr:fibronectin type III domain-containing protein [Chloroflexota bacterium]